MKKIKFAGIAAATLLAISPVATSGLGNLSMTQTAQAAATDSSSSSIGDWFTNGINDIFNKIKDALNKATQKDEANKEEPKTDNAKTAVDTVKALPSTITYNADKALPKDKFSDFLKYNNKNISMNGLARFLYADGVFNNDDDDISGKIQADSTLKAKISLGEDNNDAEKIVNNMVNNGNGAKFPIAITIKDADGKVLGTKQMTFVNNITVTPASADLAVKFADPITVAEGSDVIDVTLSNSAKDTTVTDKNGTTVTPSVINPSSDFYNSKNDARTKTDPVNLGGKFNVNGATYYQPVTLTFNDKDKVNVGEIFDNMQNANNGSITFNNDPANNVDIDRDANSVTFVREIKVGNTTTDNNNNNNNNSNNNENEDNNNTEETWTETSNPGIVTVNNSLAQLHDDSNAVTSRSLAARSAWQTDKFRTSNKTGQVQYRVSTHEWVNAENVLFSKKTSDPTGAFTKVNNLTGYHKVTLAGPSGFVYTLFTTNGGQSNRGLAGDSAWFTDKSATDASGNVYYRVSTDEWVQEASGVTFS